MGKGSARSDIIGIMIRTLAFVAAVGLSNRDIGERLYLSHRTVGSHLYRLFPKLGVTSRAQLRNALEQPAV